MYKVFFNQKPIYLTTTFVEQTLATPVLFLKYSSKKNIIAAIKSKKTTALYLYHPKAHKLWELFFDLFQVIEAAGGVVRHTETGKYLFIFRNSKWDLPKGRIERNESVREAAVREVEEETGATGLEITQPLPETFHLFHRNGKYRLKKTYWYGMTTDYSGPLLPQNEEGIEKAEWKDATDVEVLFENAYANIQLLWEKVAL